ncbi:hypothetical protein A2U01_0104931, partial [Trifolium medium]|nr:hypothetical protein [Trifolium medium]
RLGGCLSSPMAALANLAAFSLFLKVLSGSGLYSTNSGPDSCIH